MRVRRGHDRDDQRRRPGREARGHLIVEGALKRAHLGGQGVGDGPVELVAQTRHMGVDHVGDERLGLGQEALHHALDVAGAADDGLELAPEQPQRPVVDPESAHLGGGSVDGAPQVDPAAGGPELVEGRHDAVGVLLGEGPLTQLFEGVARGDLIAMKGLEDLGAGRRAGRRRGGRGRRKQEERGEGRDHETSGVVDV